VLPVNKLIPLISLGLALPLPCAAAPVPWDFVATSCADDPYNPGSCGPRERYPVLLATLTLTGPTSSGAAYWTGANYVPPAYTGDSFALDFSANYPAITPAFTGNPTPFTECESFGQICEFNLSWSESGGQLDRLSLYVNGIYDTLGIYGGFGLAGGEIATDGVYIGAGRAFAGCDDVCRISGAWEDAPSSISEPSTLGLLGLALLWLGFLRVQQPRRRGHDPLGIRPALPAGIQV
jgi:hypothetical protein